MNVLILSTATGGGHNSAARALQVELGSRNIPCIFNDVLDFASKKTSQIVSNTYSHVTVKSPKLFGSLYKVGDTISTCKFKSIIYRLNSLYGKKLYNYISEQKIDTVICPHLFSAQAMTYLKHHYTLSVKTYAVATDYTCIPFWEDCEMDAFFIPHSCLLEEFKEHGVLASSLVPIGIPTHSDFLSKLTTEEAKSILNENPHVPLVSIMCGSMGFGNITPILYALLEALPYIKLFVVCGQNKALYNTIKDISPRLRAEHFINYTPTLLKASDILLTKPGGLTSTEAAVTGVPLIHLPPIPGCETKNRQFFNTYGLSLSGATSDEIILATKRLLEDSTLREEMLINQKAFINPHATADICNFVQYHSRR